MPAKTWKAIEGKQATKKALGDWRELVSAGADDLSGFRDGVKWRPDFGFWTYFGDPYGKKTPGHWNAFGKMTATPRSHMLVQINPPMSGIPTGMQGLFATDPSGSRWALHGGRIHPSRKRVSAEEFGSVSGLKPVSVEFSDGVERLYFPVCKIDANQLECLSALAAFISSCERVRLHFAVSPAEADLENNVAEAEQPAKPEKGGEYDIPPHPGGVAERKHADVWNALVKNLNTRGIDHSNGRLGRYGPDLRTTSVPFVLFELKTDANVHSAYSAVGQLSLYEDLAKKTYRKVVVIPEGLSSKILSSIKNIGFHVVHYSRIGKKIVFDSATLNAVLK